MTRPSAVAAGFTAVFTAVGALTAACSANRSTEPPQRTLTVLAASSLTGSFQQLATTFQSRHPGVHVRFSFDSSATLAEQVVQGAPADVLATADTSTMHTAVAAHANAGPPTLFASNVLVLIVPKSDPARIKRFSDLDKPGVSWVMCVPSAPCGALAQAELKAHHITGKPKSQEIDVKAVLTKVATGNADAGLVYATDAQSEAKRVRAIPIPHSAHFVNEYPIVALKDSGHPALARAWVHLVLSPQGQRVLRAAGFGRPSGHGTRAP